MTVILTRRSVLTGIIAAPIVVRTGLIMPVTPFSRFGWDVTMQSACGDNLRTHFNVPTYSKVGARFRSEAWPVTMSGDYHVTAIEPAADDHRWIDDRRDAFWTAESWQSQRWVDGGWRGA